MNKTAETMYRLGFDTKIASVGEHVKTLYRDLKEKFPALEDESSVPGQAVTGGAVGAGLGGLSSVIGYNIPKTLAEHHVGPSPITADMMHSALQTASSAGKGFHQFGPNVTKGMAFASRLGKSPLTTMAIPAGVLALIAGIRAHYKNQ